MHKLFLERVQMLAARFPKLGVGPDLASMSLIDLWAVCRYLQRLSDG